MHPVTFLAPYGATFSHDAYTLLAKRYGAPPVSRDYYVPAPSNEDVLPLLGKHGGYGTIAMQTDAEGRNDVPFESFIRLLGQYQDDTPCPIAVLGAVRMRIRFHLMARPGVALDQIAGIIAHPKALGACRTNCAKLCNTTTEASSNGEAARLVAQTDTYAEYAAIGPASAAQVHGLQVLDTAFEDHAAVTTFFLIGPRASTPHIGALNHAVLVFKVKHEPNALARPLFALGDMGFNLTHIHSLHVGNNTYHFVVEVVVPSSELARFKQVVEAFAAETEQHLLFGPFEMTSE